MRVLGVSPSKKDVHICVIEDSIGEFRAAVQKKVTLPADDDESRQLERMRRLMDTLILEESPQRVVVVKAGQSRFGNASALRHKIECVVQLAAVARDVPVTVMSPLTIRAFQKSHDASSLTGGSPFKPVGCVEAGLAAWCDGAKHGKS
jgi:Holliday junction resolvasome RuvABC endonuclease subunit